MPEDTKDKSQVRSVRWDDCIAWGGDITIPPLAVTFRGEVVTYRGEIVTYAGS